MRSLHGLRIEVQPPAAQGAHARPRRSLRWGVAALLACTCLAGGAAYAQDATWNGSTTDWNTSTNWTPNTVPTNTATFAATGSTSVDNASGAVAIGAIVFNAVSQAYSFTIDNPFLINGTGVANNSANTQTFTIDSTLTFENASTANNGTGAVTYNDSGTLDFINSSSAGNAAIFGTGGTALTFSNNSTAGNATITGFATTTFNDSATAGNATIVIGPAAGTLQFNATSTAGTANITNDSSVIFNGSSNAASATILNNEIMSFNNSADAGTAVIANAFKLTFTNSSTADAATITTDSGGTTSFTDSSTGGNARFINNAGGTFDMSGLTDGGMTAGSIEGAGNHFLGANALTVGSNNLSTTVSGVISDGGTSGGTGGSLIKVGSGTLTLTNAETYTGATTVDAGALMVNGSIAASSLTTVNNGASLFGAGTAGSTQINSGGNFAPGSGAPGTSMTVAGNLAFASGALYVISLNPTTSSFATVSGTASLAGTVQANFASGSYIAKQYTILTANGGVSGAFSGITNVDLPAGFTDSLSYNADDAFLNLFAALPTGGLNQNERSVAAAISNYFNSVGTLPREFVDIFGLTGTALQNALTQLDGEDATGAERGAFDLMNEFLGLLLDPFVDGRGGGSTNGGALGFAPDQRAELPPDVALAYASVLKAPPPATFSQRWSTWASGFGGSAVTNGDPAVGSDNVTTTTYGYAAGMDYHVSPDTVLGFSLAGGGTNWNLVNALGTGRSTAFLAGVYGVTHDGPWYLAGALAFANNWFTTGRTALGNQLTADFQGQSYSARLEGGYRFALPMDRNAVGITPYAAIQVQDFRTPAYNETDLTGGGFGLAFNAKNGTDTRSELGTRFDDLAALGTMPLILRAKVAWAHDFVSNPALDASFESLPGSSFTVFGAPIPRDSALTSAGAQLFFSPNWSLLAKFDGEFASGSQLYAGSGTLRYTW
jgi:autotransporter-associated beta strand protein